MSKQEQKHRNLVLMEQNSIIHERNKNCQFMRCDGKGVGNELENCVQELVKKLPSTPISWNRGKLEARPSEHGHY